MIVFDSVRWQNFTSYGNYWTEVDLNNKTNTLMVGVNGAGKSTFLDAISYGLFGKPHRNINKPELINKITGKHLLVEVKFSVGKHNYLIRRGMKPNLFEIYLNGEMLKQDNMTKDQQAFLENNILKINHKSFGQIVVLGAGNYTPFMELPGYSRRLIIEDLLDLQVFSSMNQLLKERVALNRDNLLFCENEIRVLESNLKLHNEHLKSMAADIKQSKKDLEKKIKEQKATDAKQKKLTTTLLNNRVKCEEKLLSFKKYELEIQKLEIAIDKLVLREQKINKQIDFYTISCKCPTCRQAIDETFKEEVIKHAQANLELISKNYQLGTTKINKLRDKLKPKKQIEDKIDEINAQLYQLQSETYATQSLLKTYEEELAKIEDRLENVDTTRKQIFEEKLVLEQARKEELIYDRDVLAITGQLLKDGGIKSLIIKQYIPVMNKVINQYLHHLGLFINFNLDENFNEVIKARNFEDRSYESFSQGEKARINLAILFSWRAIAKMRNSSATNLLVFDEIFDGPLDLDGSSEFMKILSTMVGDVNVFFISHNVDNISDKFENVLRFQKIKNFSQMDVL